MRVESIYQRRVVSYAGAQSTGHVRIVSDLSVSIEGRDVNYLT